MLLLLVWGLRFEKRWFGRICVFNRGEINRKGVNICFEGYKIIYFFYE